MKSNSIIKLCLIALLPLAMSCGGKKDKIKATDVPKGPPPQTVEVFVVTPTTVNETLDVPGTILSGDETTIYPEISGRLTYLNIPEGKTVGKGTVLATIYDGDLRAQLQKLKTQLEVQKEKVKRYEALLQIDGVSKQEFDLIKLETANIEADINIIESNLVRTQIHAPFSGQLGLKRISNGAYVSPSTPITTIRNMSELMIDFSVPEKYISQVQKGTQIYFTSESKPSTEFKGLVVATESGVNENDRNLIIRAKISDKDDVLMPGGFVKVKLAFSPNDNALMIPSNAIIPQARTKQVALLKDGIVELVDVETGLRDSARIQIVKGLNPGDTIVTTGLMRLRGKDKVKVGKVNTN